MSKRANKCLQLTVKSVTFFAKQKNAPLFTSAEAGVIFFQVWVKSNLNSSKLSVSEYNQTLNKPPTFDKLLTL